MSNLDGMRASKHDCQFRFRNDLIPKERGWDGAMDRFYV